MDTEYGFVFLLVGWTASTCAQSSLKQELRFLIPPRAVHTQSSFNLPGLPNVHILSNVTCTCCDIPTNHFTYLPIYPSTYLCLSLLVSTYLPTYLSTIYPSTHLPICLSTYLPIYLSTYRPIDLSTYRPIDLSTYLPIHLSTYLPIHLST